MAMKNLIVGLVLLLAIVAGVGYYRGWFQVSTGGPGGNPSITVDRDKIKADEEKAKRSVQDVGQKVGGRTGAGTGEAKAEPPKP
jgi:hypothetical protein